MNNRLTYNKLGRYGRLGNQMFQIASTIGVARKSGFGFAFPEWKNYDHLERFNSREDIDVQKYFKNPLPVYEGNPPEEYFIPWGYYEFRMFKACSLGGHMQSEKYFLHCQDEVRFYFESATPMPSIDYVAIHCRFGDYDNNYHPIQNTDYYYRAMAKMPAGSKFLVFSDEPQKASKVVPNSWGGQPVEFVPSGSGYMNDFDLMRSCKHFIICNSTFSWWAAWLGEYKNKKVVAPSNWFGQIAKLSAKDLYCKGWEII